MINNSYTANTNTFSSPSTYKTSTQNYVGNTVRIALAPTAVAPVYQTAGSVGSDLSCLDRVALMPNQPVMVDTGVSIAIPQGSAGLVYLRSSLALQGIVLCNGVGVIDPDYRGTIKMLLMNTCATTIVFNKGDRLAQLVITPVITPQFTVMTELDNTNRADGGFGSTGLS